MNKQDLIKEKIKTEFRAGGFGKQKGKDKEQRALVKNTLSQLEVINRAIRQEIWNDGEKFEYRDLGDNWAERERYEQSKVEKPKFDTSVPF